LTFTSTPVQFYSIWDFARGGAGEWTGGYVSSKHLVDIYYKMREVAIKYNLHPQFYGRGMFGGHYWVGRMLISFSKNDPEEVEKVRKCFMDMDEEARKVGSFIRYKAPPWAKARNFEDANPNTVELMQKIRKLLDPNGVMNPGQGL
ncbi:MAG: FAD-linked oxidase C-terminal domain-containing protein, partial [Candidatus Lokiarchaeia archaeon]